MLKKKLLVCITAGLVLAGCGKKGETPPETPSLTPSTTEMDVETLLKRSSNEFENIGSVELEYSRNISYDGSKEIYEVNVTSVRSSETTLQQGSQAISGTVKVTNPILEYFYDDDNGKRYVFNEEGEEIGTFPVTKTMMESENVMGQLLEEFKEGLIPLEVSVEGDDYVVSGNGSLPDICDIELTFERPEDYSWNVEVVVGEDCLPKSATYKNGNEEIVINYVSFDDSFDINIPEKGGQDE